MNQKALTLNENQWCFLAVLHLLKKPLSLDFLRAVAPLTVSESRDLMTFCRHRDLVREEPPNQLQLTEHLDQHVLQKLNQIDSNSFLSELAEKIRQLNLEAQLPHSLLVDLYLRTGEKSRAGIIELEIARENLLAKKYEVAIHGYLRGLRLLSDQLGVDKLDVLFITAVQDLYQLMLPFGRNMGQLPEFMEIALDVATRRGDKRSQALLSLQLGFLFVFSDRRPEAMKLLALGRRLVQELGDEDIFEASYVYFAHFAHVKGNLREAAEFAYKSAHTLESKNPTRLFDFWPAIFMGYFFTFIGEIHSAIGYLVYILSWLERRSFPIQASVVRATLGVVLLQTDKKEEARTCLEKALSEGELYQNFWTRYLAESGLAVYYCRNSRLPEARNWVLRMRNTPREAGIKRQFNSPWVLEVLYELERHGYDVIPDFNFTSKYDQIMQEPNIHMQGVALRLRAHQEIEKNGDPEGIKNYLTQSEICLDQAGDPTELAKTRIELAGIFLKEGDRDKANRLAVEAWNGLSKYCRNALFPEKLKTLFKDAESTNSENSSQEDFRDSIFSLKKDLTPMANFDELIANMVSKMNQFFKCERGGFFWRDKATNQLSLKAGINLSIEDVTSDFFRYNYEQVRKCMTEGRARVDSSHSNTHIEAGLVKPKMLCIPILLNDEVKGVLYHDNLYLDDFFQDLTAQQLITISANLSIFLDAAWGYNRLINETKLLIKEESRQILRTDKEEIITWSPVMEQLLNSADQVARTEGSVLILGETGVGKELLAHRIHRNSPRHSKNIITIDLTTIPENLIESELFGHEKGAFTGADRRKLGRLEMADGGTLFIDELGEIPRHIQAKLLRVIQEKTFIRIGGIRPIRSDFRLIAATNRDLIKEVNGGRFREDLYYRLNTVPLFIPPLRARREDIELIAKFFLNRFGRKYNRQNLELSPADLQQLKDYSWPGNIRELRNVIERAVIMCTSNRIEITLSRREPEYGSWRERNEAHREPGDGKKIETPTSSPGPITPTPSHWAANPENVFFVNTSDHLPSLDDIQKLYIEFVMEKTGKRVSGPGGAAAILKVKRTTLYGKMKRLGMDNKWIGQWFQGQ